MENNAKEDDGCGGLEQLKGREISSEGVRNKGREGGRKTGKVKYK